MSNELTTIEARRELLLRAAAEINEVGRLPKLKFLKGRYFRGDDEVLAGREVIAHVTQWTFGWVKWLDGKPVEQRIGKVCDGFRMPERHDLGDMDQTQWPKDGGGVPRDPWQRQHYLPLEDAELGEVLIFVTGSYGGRQAISKLCASAAHNLAKGLPIIRLGASNYKHPVYGRIEEPTFTIVRYSGADVSVPAAAPLTVAQEMSDEIPF
jgi:hypothetical protein